MLCEPYLFSSFDSLKSSSLPSDTFRDTLPGPLIMVKKKSLTYGFIRFQPTIHVLVPRKEIWKEMCSWCSGGFCLHKEQHFFRLFGDVVGYSMNVSYTTQMPLIQHVELDVDWSLE